MLVCILHLGEVDFRTFFRNILLIGKTMYRAIVIGKMTVYWRHIHLDNQRVRLII